MTGKVDFDAVAVTRKMRLPIPQPRVAAPKAAKSWAALRPGQWLQNWEDILGVTMGRLWVVMNVDNQGADLKSDETLYRLTNRDWAKRWTRSPKPKLGSTK